MTDTELSFCLVLTELRLAYRRLLATKKNTEALRGFELACIAAFKSIEGQCHPANLGSSCPRELDLGPHHDIGDHLWVTKRLILNAP
jgi:hypothetical protein